MNIRKSINKLKIPITLTCFLVFFLFYPFASTGSNINNLPKLAISFVFFIIPCLSMFLKKRKYFYYACLLALASLVLSIAALVTDYFILINLVIIIEFIFFTFTLFMVVKHIYVHDEITIHKVLTAILGYLLVGFIFAFIYTYISLYDPNILMYITNGLGTQNSYWHFSDTLYFSLVTLTSLGFGDIVPVTSHVRMLAAMEAVIGQMYIAVFIARLIGLMVSQRILKRKKTHLNN